MTQGDALIIASALAFCALGPLCVVVLILVGRSYDRDVDKARKRYYAREPSTTPLMTPGTVSTRLTSVPRSMRTLTDTDEASRIRRARRSRSRNNRKVKRMFLMDIKDFRNAAVFPCEFTEDAMLDALIEAGVSFDKKPLALRVRVKDMDLRMILAKGDLLDDNEEEFRLNVYFPPFTAGATEILKASNAQVRHVIKHIAQTRSGESLTKEPEELEQDARDYAKTGVACPVGTLTPVKEEK